MDSVEKKLAELIREHPNLYDPSRRDYKDTLKGQLSWRDIADSMGRSEDELKLKWKNLRDKFCKAKKRLAKRSQATPGGEAPVERPVPALYGQLAWLNAYVKPRGDPGDADEVSTPVSGDDASKDEKQQQHRPLPLPVVSAGFPLDQGLNLKRKRPSAATDSDLNAADSLRDEDELFLLSLLPSLKRLNMKKRMEVRMKFQQVLYAAEFED